MHSSTTGVNIASVSDVVSVMLVPKVFQIYIIEKINIFINITVVF